ncbi:MAG: hypothetical protein ACFLMY_17195 [Candidatus Brachytrichaceae bacterium NZ_4S206]
MNQNKMRWLTSASPAGEPSAARRSLSGDARAVGRLEQALVMKQPQTHRIVKPMQITAEQLAYWYLRLNGFLTIQNFIVHPDTGSGQRTDADILGVRFPYRAELRPNPMVDDEPFVRFKDKPYIIIAEVKRNLCSLNGPWTEPEKENLQRVLRAIGAFPEDQVETVAKNIYTSGMFSNTSYYITLACFGKTSNSDISKNFPNVPQILWDKVLTFIYHRFRTYRNQKSSHGQWDEAGRNLWDCVWQNRDLDTFKKTVMITDRRRS